MKLNLLNFIFFAILLFASLISNKRLPNQSEINASSVSDLYESFKSHFENKDFLKNLEIHKEKVKLYLNKKLIRLDLPKPYVGKTYSEMNGIDAVVSYDTSINSRLNKTDFTNIAKYLDYVKLYNLTSFDTIIDIGAGIGRFESLFSKYFKYVDVIEEFPKFYNELEKI
jgi:hypothetical protein